MNSEEILSPSLRFSLPIIVAILSFFFVLLCEWLHAKRIKRVAALAFGPSSKARSWTVYLPWFRSLFLALMVWSLLFLFLSKESIFLDHDDPNNFDKDQIEHLVLVLDFSPSMLLEDAGAEGDRARKDQMRHVVESIMGRLGKHVRYSLITFYTKSLPIVEHAYDKAIVSNVLDELPIERVMGPGKTDLTKAVNRSLEMAQDYREQSTTLVYVTDGDSIAMNQLNYIPQSVKKTIVLGVGNTKQGISLDGHMSKQESENLSFLAKQLKGKYIDVNQKHLVSSEISHLVHVGDRLINRTWNLVDIAMLLFISLSCLYAFLPVFQDTLGSSWRIVHPKQMRAES